ncbi:helix-turn-helix domain-containing protein [Micromonospora sp. NPDC023956]|uniref:helix-turn-helix domain-containing protein n=1 Tax=Micromonospora sp. NPDC023956 TaxID=3155722 RepID=UPI0033CE4278
MDSTELLPVGRRVAYWRGRRKLSQQVLADRLGKSKSWVDKVERGVRSLDRVSTLQDIAAVLRIDTAVLLGRNAQPAGVAERAEGVERIRVALSAYEIALERPAARRVLPADRLVREVAHAWTTFQHARYPQTAAELINEAADMAARVGDGHDHHRTGFGPTAVQLARVAATVESGDAEEAVAWHEKATTRDGWRWLPAEHRAAHLIDAARAYQYADDPINAGRVLMEADRIAPAEIRHRPAGRDVLAQVARDPAAPTTLIQLAATLGVG